MFCVGDFYQAGQVKIIATMCAGFVYLSLGPKVLNYERKRGLVYVMCRNASIEKHMHIESAEILKSELFTGLYLNSASSKGDMVTRAAGYGTRPLRWVKSRGDCARFRYQ